MLIVALVMPLVKPCSLEDRKSDNVMKNVVLAIERMASAGYCHDDLR